MSEPKAIRIPIAYIKPDSRIEKVYLGGRVVQPDEKGWKIDKQWKLKIKFKEDFQGMITIPFTYLV